MHRRAHLVRLALLREGGSTCVLALDPMAHGRWRQGRCVPAEPERGKRSPPPPQPTPPPADVPRASSHSRHFQPTRPATTAQGCLLAFGGRCQPPLHSYAMYLTMSSTYLYCVSGSTSHNFAPPTRRYLLSRPSLIQSSTRWQPARTSNLRELPADLRAMTNQPLSGPHPTCTASVRPSVTPTGNDTTTIHLDNPAMNLTDGSTQQSRSATSAGIKTAFGHSGQGLNLPRFVAGTNIVRVHRSPYWSSRLVHATYPRPTAGISAAKCEQSRPHLCHHWRSGHLA